MLLLTQWPPLQCSIQQNAKLKFEPQSRTGCAQWCNDYCRPTHLAVSAGTARTEIYAVAVFRYVSHFPRNTIGIPITKEEQRMQNQIDLWEKAKTYF